MFKLFKPKPRCEKCGSKDLRYSSSWVRGWNYHCEQAIGDKGTRCYDCGNIVWEKSYEQFKNSQPKWCKAYKDKN